MAIQVALEHRTAYRFDRLIRLSPHVVRLRPAPGCRTPILAYSLRVDPEHHFINWQQDPFGNHLARLVFPEPTRALSITVDIVAEMTVVNPFDFFLEPEAERYPYRYDQALARDLAPYLTAEDPGPGPVASRGRSPGWRRGDRGLPGRRQPASAADGCVHHPIRAGRADP
jgi:transglutaminase-like putative cysteine protease